MQTGMPSHREHGGVGEQDVASPSEWSKSPPAECRRKQAFLRIRVQPARPNHRRPSRLCLWRKNPISKSRQVGHFYFPLTITKSNMSGTIRLHERMKSAGERCNPLHSWLAV